MDKINRIKTRIGEGNHHQKMLHKGAILQPSSLDELSRVRGCETRGKSSTRSTPLIRPTLTGSITHEETRARHQRRCPIHHVKCDEEVFMGGFDSVREELLEVARDKSVPMVYRLEAYRLYLASCQPNVNFERVSVINR